MHHGTLPDGFKARLTTVLQNLDLTDLPADDKKIIGFNGTRLVPQNDAAFDLIRDLVKVLHIDLNPTESQKSEAFGKITLVPTRLRFGSSGDSHFPGGVEWIFTM